MRYARGMSLMRLPMVVVCVAVLASGCKDSAASAQSSSGPAASAAADPVVAEAGGRRILLSEVDAKWQEFDAAERARVTQLNAARGDDTVPLRSDYWDNVCAMMGKGIG